jgi:hypothetical protein
MFHGAGFVKKQKYGGRKLAAQRDLTLFRQLEKADVDGAGSTLPGGRILHACAY